MSDTKRIKGVVARIVKNRYGFGVILANHDGFYFNTKYQPKFNEGDEVGLEFAQKSSTSAQILKAQVFNAGVGAPAPQRSARPGQSAYVGGDSRQDSIIWQSCQKVAAALVGEVLNIEDIEKVLPTFDALTARLFEDANNPRESAAYKAFKARGADVSSAVDTTEGWPESVDEEQPQAGDDWDEWPSDL